MVEKVIHIKYKILSSENNDGVAENPDHLYYMYVVSSYRRKRINMRAKTRIIKRISATTANYEYK